MSDHIMGTYVRDISLVKGQGCWVCDDTGKKYLDMIGGLGTCSVGHSNPQVSAAISAQAELMLNPSNLFHSPPQQKLAHKLCKISGMSKVFFSNSGTESVEAAIKLARKATGRSGIVAMSQGFHGRSMGSLSATWGAAYREPFQPLVPGFTHATYGEVDDLQLGPDTAAVLVEPIQGEAGVVVPPDGYLEHVQKMCKANGSLLILDEVQTGNGRTGRYFNYQYNDMKPDIVCTAKGLGNGLPIGATLCRGGLDLAPGDHGSTFGGNPLCCAGAMATMSCIEDVLPDVNVNGQYLKKQLEEVPGVAQVRGQGLMVGIQVQIDAKQVVKSAADHGMLVNAPRPDIVRMLPPLTISTDEMDHAVEVLTTAISEVME